MLAAQIDPSANGGNFLPGSKVRYVVRPTHSARLLLLNIDASAKVSVLYPGSKSETRPVPAGQAFCIPEGGAACVPDAVNEKWIRIQGAPGMDLQLIFAFEQVPPEWQRLTGLHDLAPDDPRLQKLLASLAALHGKFTFTTTQLRILAP